VSEWKTDQLDEGMKSSKTLYRKIKSREASTIVGWEKIATEDEFPAMIEAMRSPSKNKL